jgi:FlaG/FlaF family flagellin (archaellin)
MAPHEGKRREVDDYLADTYGKSWAAVMITLLAIAITLIVAGLIAAILVGFVVGALTAWLIPSS